MRRTVLTFLMATVVLVTAVAFFAMSTAPRAAMDLGGPLPPTIVLGAYHVHSSQSDGSGSVAEIAHAASAAGLGFVIFTDHGDGTRPPAAPVYIDGVLCIDALEVNTLGGHVVALGLRTASPYPLAGEARDVIDDVHRLGGVAIAAHPDSPDPGLRWRGAARYDGLEWINADAEWRDDSPRALLTAAARSLVRAPESIVSLFSRPTFTLQRWDAALRSRSVFALAALDAHARFGLGDGAEPQGRTVLAWPSYRSMFGTMGQAVTLDTPLSGDPQADARAILDALAAGRTFTTMTALARPAALEFFAEQDGHRVRLGERLEAFDPGRSIRIMAVVPQAPGARLSLLRSGQPIAEGHGRIDVTRTVAPGAYRIEAVLPHSQVPWIVSNPLYLGAERIEDFPPPAAAPAYLAVSPADAWAAEHDPSSTAVVSSAGPEVVLSYTLGGGAPAGQFAALVTRAAGESGVDRIEFVGRASAPMRLSVQVRLPGSGDGQRWRRSVYLDETPRQIVVLLEDMDPVGPSTTLRPIMARVQAILFVADTLNSVPGTSGQVWLRDVRIGTGANAERAAAGAPGIRSER